MKLPWRWTKVSESREVHRSALKHKGYINTNKFKEYYCSTNGNPLGVVCQVCGERIPYEGVVT